MGMDQETQRALAIAIGIACAAAFVVDAGVLATWVMHRVWGARWPFARKWSVLDVFLGGQVALIAVTLLGVAIGLIYGLVYVSDLGPQAAMNAISDLQTNIGFLSVLLAVQTVFTLGIPLLYLARYRVRLRDLGFSLRHLKRGLLLGAAWFVPVFAVSSALEAGSNVFNHAVLPRGLMRHLQEVQDSASVGRFLGKMPAGELIVVLVVVGLLVPIAEEICFRGFLYNSLRMRWGVRWGIAISAVLFASAHLPILAILPYLFLSVMLALCYERSGTLIAPITVHCLNNGLLVVLTGLGLVKP
jgi:membrane protease YdiL (CAAX protease family)